MTAKNERIKNAMKNAAWNGRDAARNSEAKTKKEALAEAWAKAPGEDFEKNSFVSGWMTYWTIKI